MACYVRATEIQHLLAAAASKIKKAHQCSLLCERTHFTCLGQKTMFLRKGKNPSNQLVCLSPERGCHSLVLLQNTRHYSGNHICFLSNWIDNRNHKFLQHIQLLRGWYFAYSLILSITDCKNKQTQQWQIQWSACNIHYQCNTVYVNMQ